MNSSTKLNQSRLARFQDRKVELKKLFEEGLIQFDQYNGMIDRVEEAEDRILSDERLLVTEFGRRIQKFHPMCVNFYKRS